MGRLRQTFQQRVWTLLAGHMRKEVQSKMHVCACCASLSCYFSHSVFMSWQACSALTPAELSNVIGSGAGAARTVGSGHHMHGAARKLLKATTEQVQCQPWITVPCKATRPLPHRSNPDPHEERDTELDVDSHCTVTHARLEGIEYGRCHWRNQCARQF